MRSMDEYNRKEFKMNKPDCCPICGHHPEAITKCFATEPFLDGRLYDFICHTCACVPKMWEIIDGEIITYEFQSADRLNTVEHMVSDGWTAERAEISIKAVQRLLKSPRIVVESATHVFAQLFLEDGPTMIIEHLS